LDAILLARGGGSIEDLWAFNDERVARAIRASNVPVIAGIGHETDFTIADFAADVRAPTPTGAAIQAVPDSRELRDAISGLSALAGSRIADRLESAQARLETVTARLARLSPLIRIGTDRQRVDELTRRAQLAMTNRLANQRARLAGLRLHIGALEPGRILARGYAIVSIPDGTVVSSTAQVAPGDPIWVRVADGTFGADVTHTP
jgi:exodeoxyribonuclease VII large subunit